MANDELDLERGDPARVEGGRRQRRARSSSSEGDSKPSAAAGEKLDRELHTRLVEAFNQVAEWRLAREDEELASAILEDREKMSRGLVSLTHFLTPLRQPLVLFLGLVEPVLAFGRVGRILATRWVMRRQAVAEARAHEDAPMEAAAVAGAGV